MSIIVGQNHLVFVWKTMDLMCVISFILFQKTIDI